MGRGLVALVLCLALVGVAAAGQKRAFVDPTTGLLKAVGYMDRNELGDVALDVAEDFNLGPLSWRWTGQAWLRIPTVPSAEDRKRESLRRHVEAVLADPAIPQRIKDVLNAIKDRLQ